MIGGAVEMNARTRKEFFPGATSEYLMRNPLRRFSLLNQLLHMETSHSRLVKVACLTADGQANLRSRARSLAKRWATQQSLVLARRSAPILSTEFSKSSRMVNLVSRASSSSYGLLFTLFLGLGCCRKWVWFG